MNDKFFGAIIALLGVMIGSGFTFGGIIIQTNQQEKSQRLKLDAEYEKESVRAAFEAARQHYKADTERLLGTNRFHGKPLASFADYVSYHYEIWKAVEDETIDENLDSRLEGRYPRLAPDYLAIKK